MPERNNANTSSAMTWAVNTMVENTKLKHMFWCGVWNAFWAFQNDP